MLSFSVNKTISTNLKLMTLLSIPDIVGTDIGVKWLGEFCIKAAEEGIMDEYINIDGYGFKSDKNEKWELAKYETPILTSTELGKGRIGVPESAMCYEDSTFDTIIKNIDAQRLANELLDVHDYLLTESRVDIYTVLKLSLKGNIRSKKRLLGLLEEYKMGELIKDVLENPKCIQIIRKELIDWN